MLELIALHKRLGGCLAVNELSLEVKRGECVLLRGANGAGKSTLIKIVAGVLKADRGEIRWNGSRLSGYRRRAVGYVPEAADPPPLLRVDELLALVAATKQSAPLDEEIVDRLEIELILGARISELSLGQRRRVCIAAALVGNPSLLLLDEPSNGLDEECVHTLTELLRDSPGRTMLLATHDQRLCSALATRSVSMSNGRITSDTRKNNAKKPAPKRG